MGTTETLSCFAGAILLAGCLGPLTSDDVAPGDLLMPAGSDVPLISATINQQIDENDGVGDTVPLLSGFAEGRPVKYWDFGPTPSFGAPIFMVVKRNEDGSVAPVGQPAIIDAIPGDAAYSPYWPVFEVFVTGSYNGELITSVTELAAAESMGLVETPVPNGVSINCPVVADGVLLDLGEGLPPMEPLRFYWRGQSVGYFTFGPMNMKDESSMNTDGDSDAFFVQDMYRLRRSGGEAIDETQIGIDLTNDGDRHDTNNIFTYRESNPNFTPLCRSTEVAVPNDTRSIDTFRDDSFSDFDDSRSLFNPDPVQGAVLAIEEMPGLINCPQQPQAF